MLESTREFRRQRGAPLPGHLLTAGGGKESIGTHLAPGSTGIGKAAHTDSKKGRNRMRDRKLEKKNSGLTLMELIISLAVLGILIVAASPHISQFSSGYKLRGAARELATDLQFARLLAVKENRDIQVVFTSATSYQVAQVSPWLVVKSRDFSLDYPGVTLGGLAVTFNSRGNSASSTITVAGPSGTKNITVVSTGRVKLG